MQDKSEDISKIASLDVLLLVPMPPPEAHLLDRQSRSTFGIPAMRFLAAGFDLERYIGRDLGFSDALHPHSTISDRSLTAIALATVLRDAGLRWAAIDCGTLDLRGWKRELERFSDKQIRGDSVVVWTNNLAG